MKRKKRQEHQDLAVLFGLIQPHLTFRNVVGAVWIAVDVVVMWLLVTRGVSWLGL